jgi:hypothetical protein
LFLNVLLVSRLKLWRLSPLIWLGFCNHCNLACFRWSINFKQSSWNHGLLCFSFWYPRLSLAEVFIFSLIHSQALLMSKLSSKLSKAANQISTWYFSLTSTSSSFFRWNLSKSNFALLVYLLKLLVTPTKYRIVVTVKLSLYLTKYQAMKTYGGVEM